MTKFLEQNVRRKCLEHSDRQRLFNSAKCIQQNVKERKYNGLPQIKTLAL